MLWYLSSGSWTFSWIGRCHVFVFCCVLSDRNDGDVIWTNCSEFRIPLLSTCPRTAQFAKPCMRIDVMFRSKHVGILFVKSHIAAAWNNLYVILFSKHFDAEKNNVFSEFHYPTAHEEPVAATAPPAEEARWTLGQNTQFLLLISHGQASFSPLATSC